MTLKRLQTSQTTSKEFLSFQNVLPASQTNKTPTKLSSQHQVRERVITAIKTRGSNHDWKNGNHDREPIVEPDNTIIANKLSCTASYFFQNLRWRCWPGPAEEPRWGNGPAAGSCHQGQPWKSVKDRERPWETMKDNDRPWDTVTTPMQSQRWYLR